MTAATIASMLAALPEADREEVRWRFDELAWRLRRGQITTDPMVSSAPAPDSWWESGNRCRCCGDDLPTGGERCRLCATAWHLALLAREGVPL